MSVYASSLYPCLSSPSVPRLGCIGEGSSCSHSQTALELSAVLQDGNQAPQLHSCQRVSHLSWNVRINGTAHRSSLTQKLARANLPLVSGIPFVGPVINFILNPVLLLVIYLAGAFRFWSGFIRTTYNSTMPAKVGLTALWPVLLLLSKEYRKNFMKATK